MTNNNLVTINRAINEICESLALKAELKNAFEVIYAMNKTRNKIKKMYEDLAKAEADLVNAYHEALTLADSEQKKTTLLNKLTEDKQKLFDTEIEVEIHKISPEHSPVIIKYLTAQSTYAYFDFLVEEAK